MDQPKVDFPQISVWHVYSPSSHWFCVVALVTEFECDKTWNSINQRKTLPSICDFHVKDGMCIGLFFLLLFFNIYIYIYIYICVWEYVYRTWYNPNTFPNLLCVCIVSGLIHKYIELKFCPVVLISWK